MHRQRFSYAAVFGWSPPGHEQAKDAQNLIHRLSGWRVVRIGLRRCSAEFQFPSPSLKAVTVQTGMVLSSVFVVSRPNCSSIPAN
jgi:hypothetical protein